MKVGFIGLGIMGRPMAGHLIQGGHELFLHSRSGVAPELLQAGGVACRSAREVAERADVVITMVRDTSSSHYGVWDGRGAIWLGWGGVGRACSAAQPGGRGGGL